VGRKPLLAARVGAVLIATSLGIPAIATADGKHKHGSVASAGIHLIAHPKAGAISPRARFAWRTDRREQLSCRLDAGRFRPCARSATYRRLSPGRHRFVLRSARRGVVLRRTWRVLARAAASGKLQLRITQRPSDPSPNGNATFAWTTSSTTSAMCTLDGVGAPCASPKSYSGLAAGRHTFVVKVISGKYTESTSASWSVVLPTQPSPDPTATPTPTPTPTPGTTYNKPTDLVTTNVSDTSVYLDWNQDYSRAYDGYYVRVNGGERKYYSASEGLVSGLSPATPYRFCVSVNYTSSSDPDESAQTCIDITTTGSAAPSPTPTPTPSPSPSPTPTPTPEPTSPSGSMLWSGGVEDGTFADWYAPSATATGNYGGGEYNSGSADAYPSKDVAHSGSWSSKMVVNQAGGTRLFRWKEPRAARDLVYRAWYYIPQSYVLTGDPNTGRYWILYEFKSRTADNAHNDPFWYVNAYNRSDGSLGARLAWGYQSRLEGPHKSETGWRNYGDVGVPVGRWFKIEARLRQSKDFDGAVRVTIDGQLLADVSGVRTGWPNCTFNAWCVDQAWAVTNYTDGIGTSSAPIYVDDEDIMTP